MKRDQRETSPLLPDVISSLTEQIQELVRLIPEFDKNVKILGTPRDTHRIRQTLKEQHQRISGRIKATTDMIKSKPKPQDVVKFQKLLSTFQDQVKQFQQLTEERTKKERSYNPVIDEAPKSQPTVEDPFERFSVISDSEEHDRRIIEERNQGIQEVTEDLKNLHELFVDVMHMIGEQGEELQTAEKHVADTDIQITTGVQELRKASDLQQSSRKKKSVYFYYYLYWDSCDWWYYWNYRLESCITFFFMISLLF